MKDWYELAHVYPVPLKLCDDAKNNHIENPYLVKNLQSNVEGTHGMFDDLIPDKNKK